MEILASDLLKAMDADAGIETVPAVSAPVEATPVAPDAPVEPTVTEDMKSDTFIMLMKHSLSDEQFKDLMAAATDLEVYGLIQNAERCRLNCDAMCKSGESCLGKHAVLGLAIDMAVRSGCECGEAYLAAEKAEHEAMDAIMAKFGDNARTAMREMLEEFSRKAISMGGPMGQIVRDAIAKAQASVAATATQQ